MKLTPSHGPCLPLGDNLAHHSRRQHTPPQRGIAHKGQCIRVDQLWRWTHYPLSTFAARHLVVPVRCLVPQAHRRPSLSGNQTPRSTQKNYNKRRPQTTGPTQRNRTIAKSVYFPRNHIYLYKILSQETPCRRLFTKRFFPDTHPNRIGCQAANPVQNNRARPQGLSRYDAAQRRH